MRRKGGVPPIVTVLVTIASIVAASLVAWFLWTSTRTATSTPILEVTNAYYVGSGSNWRITFTLRNVGSTSVTLSTASVSVFCDGFTGWAASGPNIAITCGSSTSFTLSAGTSTSCTISPGSSPPSISPQGDALSCQVQFQQPGVTVAFRAYRP
ncbi:MAG: hypothetical protein QXJ38_02180 [Thermofilaceae archaeon]